MANLTVNTLVAKMVDDTDLSEKQVRAALKGLVGAVQESLTVVGGSVTINGMGTFRAVQKGDRMARNPKTGEQSYVDPYIKPTFKASMLMQDVVNGRR